MKRTKAMSVIVLLLFFGYTTGFSQTSNYSTTEIILRFELGTPPAVQAQILADYNLVILEGPTPVTRFLRCTVDPIFPNLPPGAYQNSPDSITGVIETIDNIVVDIDGIGHHYDVIPPTIEGGRILESQIPPLLGACVSDIPTASQIDIPYPGIYPVRTGIFDTGIAGIMTPTGFDVDFPYIFDSYFSSQNPGYNAIESNLIPVDDNGHGTHMSSTVVAQTNSHSPLLELTAYKTHNKVGIGKLYNIIKAIDQGILSSKNIYNMSFTYYSSFNERENEKAPLRIAIKESLDYNSSLFIASAGNQKINNDSDDGEVAFPASFPNDNIITVASVGCGGALSDFSNFGYEFVDLGAPGENIPGAFINHEIVSLSGTSPAAAMVTRVASMLAGFQPDFDYESIKCAIINGVTSHPSLFGRVNSNGYLDAGRAFIYFNNMCYPGTTNGTPSPDLTTRLTMRNDHLDFLANDAGVVLDIQSSRNQNGKIGIYNTLGQLLLYREVSLLEGENEIFLPYSIRSNSELCIMQVEVNSKMKVFKFIR